MKTLIAQNRLMKLGFGYVPSAQLAVEEHGTYWTDKETVFKQYPHFSTPKECFVNAYRLHFAEGYDYVEGFVYSPQAPMLIHHAWCHDEGAAIEPTLQARIEVEYFGIIIPDVSELITSHYSVFDSSDFIADLGYPPCRWLFPEEEA